MEDFVKTIKYTCFQSFISIDAVFSKEKKLLSCQFASTWKSLMAHQDFVVCQ